MGGVEEVAARIIAGDMRSLARLITALENGDPAALPLMRVLAGRPRRAQVVGITGPPGSGKSTLVDKLIAVLRSRGLKVGVIAVDPSSPFTGGAILGDRLRMNAHATDEGVFIRSLASRGRLGGLTRATMSAARALDAAGYDIILVETVGVGQSEVEVVEVADTVVLVAVPGLGDDIQVNKAGVMEIGDLFVVNKADRDGADRVVREIRTMLETAAALKRNSLAEVAPVDTLVGRAGTGLKGPQHLAGLAGHHGLGQDFDLAAHLALGPAQAGAEGDQSPSASKNPALADFSLPLVVKTVAETGEGVEAVLDLVLAHFRAQGESGALELRRLKGARRELRNLLHEDLDRALSAEALAGLEEELALALARGNIDAQGAAESLAAALRKGGYG